MIRCLYIGVAIFISVSVMGQSDTCFSKQKIIDIAQHVSELEYKDSLKSEIIRDYKQENKFQSDIITRDSIYISILERENDIMREHIDLRLGNRDDKKWYESELFYFLSGVVTTGIIVKIL